jgi:NAD(P)H-flavin reductase/ferredoxin
MRAYMSAKVTLTINGRAISAKPGASLVDTALREGIVIPTDCCSGQCDTCRVHVLSGNIDDAGTLDGRTVLACQARVHGNAEIRFDEVQTPSRCRGSIESVEPLAPDIVQVAIRLDRLLSHHPGQYAKVTFPGCPARDYSPTAFLNASVDEHIVVFHIKRHVNGAVSNALRGKIRRGDRVWVEGPFGSAFYRPGTSRLVLVGTGTGWAPLWGIARAARLAEPNRSMKIVIGVRDPLHLYMRESLEWLRRSGVQDIIMSCTGEDLHAPDVVPGRTTQFITDLQLTDTVHAAGSSSMVESVKVIARRIGAACYADPFTTAVVQPSFFQRLRQVIETGDDALLHPRRGGSEGAMNARTEPQESPQLGRPASQTTRSAHELTRWIRRS